MKIRSITFFVSPGRKLAASAVAFLESVSTFLTAELQRSGYAVQTTRLATTPFPELGLKHDALLRHVNEWENTALHHHFHYLSVGCVRAEDQAGFELVLPILEHNSHTFVTGKLLTEKGEISLKAIHNCARIIETAAQISPDGFTNLRFAATANVRPFCPFFPAGYSKGAKPGFALALEGADLAVSAFCHASSLKEARESLLCQMESDAQRISRICWTAQSKFNVPFHGLDFSLAPFPDEKTSIGAALEALGLPAVGLQGSVAAAAFLAGILDAGKWKKVGFNGLMLPVLEDSILADRAAVELQIKDLLLFSTVCGTGLDTIPLPGDASAQVIAPILLDVAALSSRLKKPLTARLMPLPGLGAGDVTKFNFEYFSNGKAMEIHSKPLTRLLAQDEAFLIPGRKNRTGT